MSIICFENKRKLVFIMSLIIKFNVMVNVDILDVFIKCLELRYWDMTIVVLFLMIFSIKIVIWRYWFVVLILDIVLFDNVFNMKVLVIFINIKRKIFRKIGYVNKNKFNFLVGLFFVWIVVMFVFFLLIFIFSKMYCNIFF